MMEGIAQVEHVINFTTPSSHIFHTCEIFHLIFRAINATQHAWVGKASQPQLSPDTLAVATQSISL